MIIINFKYFHENSRVFKEIVYLQIFGSGILNSRVINHTLNTLTVGK